MLTKLKKQLAEGKNLITFTGMKAVGQALGMIAPLVVAKFFVPGLFGSYSLAKMIVFFFSTLLIASSQTPFIIFANQEKVQSGKINKSFSVQCVFLILSFCIFVVIMLSLSKYIIAFAKINYGDLFFVLLAFIGLALKTFLCNLFMAMDQRIKNSLAELVFGSLSVVLIFVFYFLDMINLRTAFLVYLLSAITLVIIFSRTIDFKLLLPFNFEKQHFHRMFDFTKWIFLGTTAVYFINWGDNLVLRYFVSMEDIGVYNLGYQFFKGIITLASVSSFYFLPFISQNIGNAEKIKNYLWRKRPIIFILVVVSIAILFFLIPYIFRFIYGSTYQGSINVLRILLIGAVFSAYSTFYNVIYGAAKRYKFLQILNIVQVLINILLNLLLVPVMGIAGAATATVTAYFFKALILEMHFFVKMRKLLKL